MIAYAVYVYASVCGCVGWCKSGEGISMRVRGGRGGMKVGMERREEEGRGKKSKG